MLRSTNLDCLNLFCFIMLRNASPYLHSWVTNDPLNLNISIKKTRATLGINSNSNYMYIQSNLYWKALLIFSGHPVLRGRWSKS